MRHLVFDVDVLLDVLLRRGEHGRAEAILEKAADGEITGWVAAQSLAVLDHVLRNTLEQEGASVDEARRTARSFLEWLRQHLSVLSLPGEESRLADGDDLADVQIALAARALGETACIVTNNPAFPAIEGVGRLTADQAWEAIQQAPAADATPIEFIDLKEQQRRILPHLEQNIRTVLHHGQYIMGAEIRELEERLAAHVGVEHCIAVSDGTKALLVAMMALGIGAGDEVITTPFTFIATGEMIALLGAKPVFVDIDPRTYNIDPALIEAAITPRTRAIMPVSLYGQCADMDAINAVAGKHGLPVIEDGAQSLGATYRGRQSCGLSTIGCTSFFPSKPLGCYGDGGACFTDDPALAKKMREIRVHGQDRRYHHPIIGINGRMDTLQAAIVLAKLDRFDEEVAARAKVAAYYATLLGKPESPCAAPYIEPFNTSVYAQYTVQVGNRAVVQEKLRQRGIPTAVHYPIPLSLQPAFANLGYRIGSFPVTEQVSAKVMSLPMHAYLNKVQQDYICRHL